MQPSGMTSHLKPCGSFTEKQTAPPSAALSLATPGILDFRFTVIPSCLGMMGHQGDAVTRVPKADLPVMTEVDKQRWEMNL